MGDEELEREEQEKERKVLMTEDKDARKEQEKSRRLELYK